ncbi:hypothetical protein [Kibdelosporangium aridum]|uniref:hypothetical protein n=1 Tax=Kibdelosporangium aridum TaxID=2030 RepID=UPI000526294C
MMLRKTGRGLRAVAALGVTPLLLAAGLGAAPANADPIGVQTLASCSPHWANTAAWMDCTGGTQKSWVRLGYNCGVGPITRDHHTRWYRVDPGKRRTVSAECTVRVNRAWPNVRAY